MESSFRLQCWLAYAAAGWLPFSLPAGKKFPPPVGFTGRDRTTASTADLYAWDEGPEGDQTGVAMPDGVIGIDVDCYSGKNGAQTLAEAESRWGVLPVSPYSTSRTDGSRISFYRVPEGIELQGVLPGGDVEVIQAHHRYAVVYPSIHPGTGERYRWYSGDGSPMSAVPHIRNLPELPSTWIDGLRVRPQEAAVSVSADLDFLSGGSMSPTMKNRLQDAVNALKGGSRHDSTRDNVLRIMALSAAGETGGREALTKLGEAFVTAISDRSTVAEARNEFVRMVDGPRGQQLIAANHIETDESFWDTPELKHIRTFAAARRLNPWAVLGAVLVRRLADLPPNWVLPAIVGSRASVNMFAALVGASGSSKSVTFDAAADLTGDEHVEHKPVSGEAIAKLFAYRKGDEQVWVKRSALCWYDEISTVGGIGGRSQGAGPMFRGNLATAWSGGDPGQDAASAEKTVKLGRHSFRLCLAAGVQPDLAGFILDHGGQGLPQRFLWMPAQLARRERGITDPGPLTLGRLIDESCFDRLTGLPDPSTVGPLTDIPVDAAVAAEIDDLADHRAINGCPTLDAHAVLLREKVAVGLSLLRPEATAPVIDAEAWAKAGIVMTVSDRTRQTILDRLDESKKRSAERAGELDGRRQAAATVVVEAKNIGRVADWAVTQVEANGPMTRAALRRKTRSTDRKNGWADAGIDLAVERGDLTDDGNVLTSTRQ